MTTEKLTEIKIDDLFIGTMQHRTDNVGKQVEELAESIKQRGLLQPIRVVPGEGANKGKYEVVMGQRRFLACANILKWDKIPAIISDKKDDDIDYLIDSVTENVMRLDTSNEEDKRVCIVLWNRFKNIPAICQITGLSEYFVRKHLKWNSLPPVLQKMVDKGEVSIDAADKAVEVAKYDETPNEREMVENAIQLNKLNQAQRTQVKKTKKQDVAASTSEIIAQVAAAKPLPIIQITLTESIMNGLTSLAEKTQQSKEQTAHDILVEKLTELGYQNDEQ